MPDAELAVSARQLLDRLAPAIEGDRLPHALLIEAPSLSDGMDAGLALTRRVLAGPMMAERCHDADSALYLQVDSGAHPDFDLLVPEKSQSSRASPVIPVDRIRGAIGRFLMTPVAGDRKVMMIAPAEALNNNAVTALLKIVEEPPPGASVILVCGNRHRLLATIRSRCMSIRLPGERTAAVQKLSSWEPEDIDLYRRCLEGLLAGGPGQKDRMDVAQKLAGMIKEGGSGRPFLILETVLLRIVDAGVLPALKPLFSGEERLLAGSCAVVSLDRIPELWDKLAERKRQLDGLYVDQPAVFVDLIETMAESAAPD